MLSKEINRLLIKEIANIYYKLLLRRKTDVSIFDFLYTYFSLSLFFIILVAANKQFLKEWFSQKLKNIFT